MRSHLRHVVLGTVALLLAAVGAAVVYNLHQQRRREHLPPGFELIPGVSQHIQDFHRVKMEDGRKVWEIAAKDARYFDDQNMVVVREALLQLFLKDGRIVGLRGNEARIMLDKREVSRVELSGDIALSLADYTARTQTAVYDHLHDRIVAPGGVEITGRALQLHGGGMAVDVQNERVTLLHHVSMAVQPALLKQGGANAPL